MKTITRFLATAALLFGLVGGVTFVKAERVYGSLSVAFGATWDSNTHTMGWSATGNNYTILNSGLPNGNITAYTTFHATLSNFSENADFIRLRIKDNNNQYADVNLRVGDNTIDLVALKKNSNCDFADINDITLWGGNVPTEGHTIDGEHKASVVVTDVYMVKPDASFDVATASGFGDEITSLDYITGGSKFVISDKGTNAKYFYTNNENENANVANVPYDSYFYFTLEEYTGGDIDGVYWIKITNAAGEGYPRGSDGTSNYYLNAILSYNDAVISGVKTGWGGNQKDALWYVTYDAEKGFSFQNAFRKDNGGKSWLSIDKNFATDQLYLKLYKSIEFTSTTMYPANDEIFALTKATGYNAETGEMTNGTWTFDTPVDISKLNYLMITTANTAADASHEITITDDNGVSVHGEEYSGSTAGTGGNMWLDRWNNQNAIRISIDYLKNEKSMDITKIKSLKINGTSKIANVYLTCYNNTKISGGYKAGDLVREYSTTGKFGTVCLPYKASVAGAEVYSVEGKTASSITLTKVNGLLEAGKPYFYMSTDEIGQNNEGTVRNVNFFRADFDNYDVPTPAVSNGLIGTFTETTAPEGANYYILSSNTLYNTVGCTGDDAVTVGANKAYINVNDVSSTVSGSRSAFILFDEATDINAVQDNVKADQVGIFNINGQRLNQLKKGLNIINGKKVMVK